MLEAGDLRLDPAAHRCWRGDAEIELTPAEFALLEFLLRRAGEVVSKREILEHVWDYDFEGDPNIVEVYIGTCATSSTGRSAARRSRRSAARATGWTPMAAEPDGRWSARVWTIAHGPGPDDRHGGLVVGVACSSAAVVLVVRPARRTHRSVAPTRGCGHGRRRPARGLASRPVTVMRDDGRLLIQVLDETARSWSSSADVAAAGPSPGPGSGPVPAVVPLDDDEPSWSSPRQPRPPTGARRCWSPAALEPVDGVHRGRHAAAGRRAAARCSCVVGVTRGGRGPRMAPVEAIRARSTRSPRPSCTGGCPSRGGRRDRPGSPRP